MARSCETTGNVPLGVKRGLWSPEEDEKLIEIYHYTWIMDFGSDGFLRKLSCSMNEEGEISLDCLQRQELNIEWVESQQCSNFIFWDNVEESVLSGEEIAPNSSSMGAATLSSFPSSL
ncbi:hypothetical protein NC653_001149 [Populus alba x Populus x berolinensis]|uniref:Uncharacterized protein n=1 Tax=Populus alba x Populus x berolinensis TaxID=444605 RepID=A0AAD6WF55_9ROSI|nr:hypothetical protein NC653_001149 [Populus alba x Populus x berolinensis]